MKKLCLMVLGILIALGVFACVSLMPAKPVFEPSAATWTKDVTPKTDGSASRTTESGEVIGFVDSYDTYAWLNIPYAAPPVGSLRWRAPQAPLSWQGSRDATSYGDACLQYWGLVAGGEGETGDIIGNEDCLSLNIWAPKSASANNPKPVMLWIHGGGNDSGTAKVYQGHHLAGGQDVVVVTVNYRLGLLGWLSNEAIRQTSANAKDASGNYGTLDLIAALEWVQRNIGEFGGDINNVTIFGESAGGKNVYSLLASPLAKSLFHRAISQSGSADTTVRTLAEDFADKENGAPVSGLVNSSNGLIESVLAAQFPQEGSVSLRLRMAQLSAQETMAMLRKMSGAALMQQASENLQELDRMRNARIIRDGVVIPQQSILSLLNDSSAFNRVPIMLGSNRDEQKLFQSRDAEFVDLKFGVLPRIKDPIRYDHVSKYISDNWKALAVDEPAKLIAANQGAPVYAYRFDWDESPSNWLADLPTLIGAAHGLEISFVFGDFTGGVPLDRLLSNENAEGRKALSLAMMDYWGNFAHTGDPGRGRSGSRDQWQPWSGSGKNLMVFDTPADGGSRMAEIRTNVADIKSWIPDDSLLPIQEDKCRAYAILFLHGYMLSDFWSEKEYLDLGCSAYPAIQFRQG